MARGEGGEVRSVRIMFATILNNSLNFHAPPSLPRETAACWAADPFLAHGGHTRAPSRPRGALAAAFRWEHASLGAARPI